MKKKVRGLLKRIRHWQRSICLAPAFFIFGCQRSGTNMLLRVLDKSPRIRTYPELDRRVVYPRCEMMSEEQRLRPKDQIDALRMAPWVRAVVFKPLIESQFAGQILDRHGGRAFWIFRRFDDVINSNIEKWGKGHRNWVQSICDGDWGDLGWRGERISRSSISLLNEVWNRECTPYDVAALFWYLRNILFFEQDFCNDRRIRLVQYEALCNSPDTHFPVLFGDMNVPYDPRFAADVSGRSISKTTPPQLTPRIRQLCEELWERLNQQFEVHQATTEGTDRSSERGPESSQETKTPDPNLGPGVR